MSDLNSCTFIGRCTRDAETKTVGAKGTSLTTWAIANNTGFGQYEKTNFFNCQMWGKQGESIKGFLTKGKQIAVSGTLENNKWQGQDGQQHDSWVLTVNQVTLLADSRNSIQSEVTATAEGQSYNEKGESVF